MDIFLSRSLRPVVTGVSPGVVGLRVWSSTRYPPTLFRTLARKEDLDFEIERKTIGKKRHDLH